MKIVESRKENIEKVTVKKKALNMGNSIEGGILHDKEDWSWNKSEEEWPETVNREEKRRKKKKIEGDTN